MGTAAAESQLRTSHSQGTLGRATAATNN